MAKKLTPRQIVLQKFPGAACYRDKYGRFIISDTRILGGGPREVSAWSDAAKTVRRIDSTTKEAK